MKGFYDITRGQLITLWTFGAIGWFFSLAPVLDDVPTTFELLSFWLVPCILIFYTLGWRRFNK